MNPRDFFHNLVLLCIFGLSLWAGEVSGSDNAARKTFTVSGYVRDAANGETLIGATIIAQTGGGTITNAYGYYALKLEPGSYTLTFSYVGFEPQVRSFRLRADTLININLGQTSKQLREVVVSADRPQERLAQAQMSVNRLDIKSIRQIPALMGEVDVIKAIQLLPGVQATTEGGSGFSVRGGSPDQNLILLDEAVVYNPSHLLGFFSVFNNDAVKGVELFKGDIPPAYGGRLSSVVDVRMNEGNIKKFSGQGGVGTISSRLTLEGPIQKDRSSFMLAGRRTYADLFLMLSSNEQIKDNTLYFYDFNAKTNYIINDRNRLFLSGYFGRDIFEGPNFGIGWGNQTATLRWNHLFSSRLFSNISLVYSRFNYQLGVPEGQPNAFDWFASMKDHSAKADFTWFAGQNNTIRFGLSGTYHRFNPGVAEGKGNDSPFNRIEMRQNRAFQGGWYVSNDQKLSERLTLKYGLRLSTFSNIGEGVVYRFDENFTQSDSTYYPAGKLFHTYANLEPRVSASFLITPNSSIKAAYTRNAQYIHLAQNSTGGTPLDIWFPSSPNVKPQLGDQFSAGYFRAWEPLALEASVEAFYKLNHNAIDFKDHADLLLNEKLEGELRFGKANSYGIEALVRRTAGRLNGWISYTWSRTFRHIEAINNGKKYPASYDRPHDISIVTNYTLNERWNFGATWVYSTGSPVTFPTGRFVIGSTIAPVYSDRNAYRLPDYHRLDLSATWKNKPKPGRKWEGEWNLSVYNAYYRKNPWVINFVPDPKNPNVTYAEMTYLFAIVPALTYNFKF
ncbi:MAG: TonB-dependent receptor [Bacteroidetes bacterium]|nr:TonB-dependent receptor [Bacteroidota bacterium]